MIGKYALTLGLFFAAQNAASCDLRANFFDLRDGGLIFNSEQLLKIKSSRGGGDDCPVTILATSTENPRSRAIREFKGTDYTSFNQALEISDINFFGQGTLKFMSFDFYAYQLSYRLDLYTGMNANNTYYLAGKWSSIDPTGVVLDEVFTVYSYQISSADKISLDWQHVHYPARIELALLLNGSRIPIQVYEQNGIDPYSPWRNPFFLRSSTVGSLAATTLTPQSSFRLSGNMTCVKLPNAFNQSICD